MALLPTDFACGAGNSVILAHPLCNYSNWGDDTEEEVEAEIEGRWEDLFKGVTNCYEEEDCQVQGACIADATFNHTGSATFYYSEGEIVKVCFNLAFVYYGCTDCE